MTRPRCRTRPIPSRAPIAHAAEELRDLRETPDAPPEHCFAAASDRTQAHRFRPSDLGLHQVPVQADLKGTHAPPRLLIPGAVHYDHLQNVLFLVCLVHVPHVQNGLADLGVHDFTL